MNGRVAFSCQLEQKCNNEPDRHTINHSKQVWTSFMTEKPITDPNIGDQLIRIRIEMYELHFEFENSALRIGAEFFLKHKGHSIAVFDPKHQAGDLNQLWKLIGKTIVAYTWNDLIEINLADDFSIEIPPNSSRPRGSIVGRQVIENSGGSKGLVWEDF
jgi:hypothetical protein